MSGTSRYLRPGWPWGWAALESLGVWLQRWHSTLRPPGHGVACSVVLKEKQLPTTPALGSCALPVPLSWHHPPWENGHVHAGSHKPSRVPSAACRAAPGAAPRRRLLARAPRRPVISRRFGSPCKLSVTGSEVCFLGTDIIVLNFLHGCYQSVTDTLGNGAFWLQKICHMHLVFLSGTPGFSHNFCMSMSGFENIDPC